MTEIKWFNQELKDLIDLKKISIKELSLKCDLNYLKFLKVIKGEVLLNAECFKRILNEECFCETEKAKLIRAFKYRNLEPNKREQIHEIERVLNCLYETIIEKATGDHRYSETKGQESKELKMALQVNDHIYKSYTNALKEAFMDGESSFEMIIFLPEMPAMIQEIFHTLKALMSCLDKRVKWHVDCMVLKTEACENSKSSHMVHLSKYIKLTTLSKNIQVHVLENSEKIKVNYGIYFQDRTLFLNSKGEGMILEYRDHRHNFKKTNYKCNELFKTYYDGPSFNNYLKTLMNSQGYLNKSHYSVRSYLSAVSIGQHFKENYGHDFLNKPVELLLEYEKKEEKIIQEKKVDRVQFICESGIENLLKDGIIPDYPSGKPLNIPSRLALICDALEKNKNGYNLRLFPKGIKEKYSFLGVINFFEMHQKSHQWILARSKPPKEALTRKTSLNKDVMYAVVVEDPHLVGSFELFCKHILWDQSLNPEKSLDKIKALVIKYYGHESDHKTLSLVNKIKNFEL